MSPRHGRRPSPHRLRVGLPVRRIALTAGTLAVAAGVGAGVAVVQPGGEASVIEARTGGDGAAFSVALMAGEAVPTTLSASRSASRSPSPKGAKATSSPGLRRKATSDPRAGRSRPTPTVPAGAASIAGRIVELVNEEREAAGCRPVSASSKLTGAAQFSTDAMARTGVLSHTGPDGSSLAERVEQAGYAWSAVGENIAQGQRTAEEVMDAWMNSAGHRTNILNCSFTELGVGVHEGDGGPWWTQDFGVGR